MEENDSYFIWDSKTIAPAILFTCLMWIVFWVERSYHLNFTVYGIRPDKISGLWGIISGPFIHGDINHLWSNTLPMLVLGITLSYFYRLGALPLLVAGTIVTGLLTWFLGRPAYHIGASGVIYFLTFFLFFKGLIARHYRLLAVSFLVAFFYGSLIWYVLPIKPGISWEGHMSGAIVGIVLAVVTRFKLPEKRKFYWEDIQFIPDDDPFMKQFDENGNFFEIIREEEE